MEAACGLICANEGRKKTFAGQGPGKRARGTGWLTVLREPWQAGHPMVFTEYR